MSLEDQSTVVNTIYKHFLVPEKVELVKEYF